MRTLLIGLLVVAVTAASAESGNRDGDFWTHHMSRKDKFVYIAGFFDGMTLAHNEVDQAFDYQNLQQLQADEKAGKKNSKGLFYRPTVQDDIHKRFVREFNGVGPDQMIDGLDKLYSDYRNRRIEVADAISAVVMSMSGSSDQDVEALLEGMRAHAGETQSPKG